MRKAALLLVLLLFSAITVSAQSVDEIIGRYLKSIGGLESVGFASKVRMSVGYGQYHLAVAGGCAAGIPKHYGNVTNYEGRPSQTQVERAEAIARELADIVKSLDDWVAKELPGLNSALEKGVWAGLRCSVGRSGRRSSSPWFDLKRRRRWLTPAQGSSLREPWDPLDQRRSNPERVSRKANPFGVVSKILLRS